MVTEEEASKRIHVSNLDPKIRDADLRAYFTAYGEVERAFVAKAKGTGQSLRYGFVHFVRADPVKHVLMHPTKHFIKGCNIRLSAGRPSARKSALG